jgi:hypothetical protein
LEEARPEPRPVRDEHDSRRDRLRDAADRAYNMLVADPEFNSKLSEALHHSNRNVPAGAPTDQITIKSVVAEKVVNRIRVMPSYYMYHSFYNPRAELFLACAVGREFFDLTETLEHMMEACIRSTALCRELRTRLIDDFDIPPSSPSIGSPLMA